MGCSFNTDLVSPTWSLMWCAMPSRDYSFNTDLVSTNLNSQRMRNRVRNLNFMSCSFNPDLISTTLNSQEVHINIPWVTDSILTFFQPLQSPRRCAMLFHELLIQYWLHFEHAELSGSTLCHLTIYSLNVHLVSTTLYDIIFHWKFMTLFSVENSNAQIWGRIAYLNHRMSSVLCMQISGPGTKSLLFLAGLST